jgi:hypothetical protein
VAFGDKNATLEVTSVMTDSTEQFFWTSFSCSDYQEISSSHETFQFYICFKTAPSLSNTNSLTATYFNDKLHRVMATLELSKLSVQ